MLNLRKQNHICGSLNKALITYGNTIRIYLESGNWSGYLYAR